MTELESKQELAHAATISRVETMFDRFFKIYTKTHLTDFTVLSTHYGSMCLAYHEIFRSEKYNWYELWNAFHYLNIEAINHFYTIHKER